MPAVQGVSCPAQAAIRSHNLKMDSEDSDDSDEGLKNIKKVNKKLSLEGGNQRPNPRSKYNIWTSSLQEDLMENLRDCGVNSRKRDRNVENYDYTIKYRSNSDGSNKYVLNLHFYYNL